MLTNHFQRHRVSVSQPTSTATLLNRIVGKNPGILIRDQNLKDNIMAVQRRIPRYVLYSSILSLEHWLIYCFICFFKQVATSPTAELGSVMAPGSKKQNLNHLLNFHYAPRDVEGSSSSSWSHGRPGFNNNNNRNKNRWLPPVQRHRYDKNQFLLARYYLDLWIILIKRCFFFTNKSLFSKIVVNLWWLTVATTRPIWRIQIFWSSGLRLNK